MQIVWPNLARADAAWRVFYRLQPDKAELEAARLAKAHAPASGSGSPKRRGSFSSLFSRKKSLDPAPPTAAPDVDAIDADGQDEQTPRFVGRWPRCRPSGAT